MDNIIAVSRESLIVKEISSHYQTGHFWKGFLRNCSIYASLLADGFIMVRG